MKHRRIVAVVMFALPLAAVGVACSFPDVSFGPAGDDGAVEPDVAEPAPDVDAGDAAADVIIDMPEDAAVRDDATARVDASGCDATCDCDNDGYWEIGCDAGADASGQPGDCDDLDPLRHPDAPYTAEPPVGHEGDWNCDGEVQAKPRRSIRCTQDWRGCTGEPGFIGEPRCGTRADYYVCRKDGLFDSCSPKPAGVVVTVTCR